MTHLIRKPPAANPPLVRDLTTALAAALLFAWIATAALAAGIPAADFWIRDAVHSAASAPLTTLMRTVSNVGGGWFLCSFGVLIVIVLARIRRRREAAVFAIALAGANLLEEGMKLIFHRPRPEPFFGYDRPLTYSFPSGHAFVSLCFYLALADVLVDPRWPPRRRLVAWSAAVLLILAIGISRIYLGVHYPTDVAAGYAGAIAWTSVVRAVHPRWR